AGGYVSHSFMVKINSQNNNDTSPDSFFVKINMRKHAQQMFDAEIIGSHALREVCTPFIRIPQPIGIGNMSTIDNDNQGSWFLAEYVTMARSKKKKTNKRTISQIYTSHCQNASDISRET
ncbi:unnamed protein product, partial [Rotaria socialis]